MSDAIHDAISALPEDSFGGRLRDWGDTKGSLGSREEEGEPVSASEYEAVDDDAVYLLEEVAGVVLDVAVLDPGVWSDIADQFTCTEADAIKPLLDILYGEAVGAFFIQAHAAGDDEGDLHYKPEGGE